jgi:NAD(P)H-hydrate epimerase
MLDGIREINNGFPLAKVVAVDIPSGLPSDLPSPVGEFARADATVTFTAPKLGLVLPPNCDHTGELIVGAIGSPESLYDHVQVSLVEPAMFRGLLAPRPRSGHKGTFGHVLVIGGSPGKTGAPSMTGMAALRAGAGLVTVGSAPDAIPQIASHASELMTADVDAHLDELMHGKTVIAIGPGLGRDERAASLVRKAAGFGGPMVMDADSLFGELPDLRGRTRVLTPHPGEMSRLTGKSIADVQKDRLGAAREFAMARGVTLLLKGQRTVIAFPDGRAWINPTGTPALGTGGTGDILTGLIAGFLAQFPKQPDQAVAAAVYLGGLAAEIGAGEIGEKPFIATDILKYLPRALEACA